ncbi:unnamed protein product, partial [Allacma fusca]
EGFDSITGNSKDVVTVFTKTLRAQLSLSKRTFCIQLNVTTERCSDQFTLKVNAVITVHGPKFLLGGSK